MLKTQKVAPLINLLIVTFSWFYIIAYLNCVQKLLTIIVNMTAAMSVFEQFDVNCDISSQASRWKDYIDRYEDYCLAFDITDAKRKTALLLHSAGVDVKKIHKRLVIHTPGENEDEYNKNRHALNNYIMLRKNGKYEIFNFHQEKQKPEE